MYLLHFYAGSCHQECNIVDIASKIGEFESQFKLLHKSIREELDVKGTDVMEILNALTLLPIELRETYKTTISELLPSLPRKGSISELFLHINPLLTFIDYGLLEYIIKEFGSEGLKVKMQSYSFKVDCFLKETTVK